MFINSNIQAKFPFHNFSNTLVTQLPLPTLKLGPRAFNKEKKTWYIFASN